MAERRDSGSIGVIHKNRRPEDQIYRFCPKRAFSQLGRI